MPTYDYRCSSCGKVEEQIHGMNENPSIACSCGGPMEKIFSPNYGGVIFRGGTEAINYRENRYRQKRSVEMERRQRERYGHLQPKVKPNIGGVEVESWSDAKKLAKECGLNSDSYTPYVEKEKKGAI